MKAILISRVSTEEQREANNSLPAQSARLQAYCERKEWTILKEFSFDESAYKDQRSDFDDILDFVINQKEKVAVCFDKVDRLSRNIFDKRVSTLYEKALKDEIELHFVSDGQAITSQLSATEKFQFSISLGLAKYYSDAISDNVKRATEAKLHRGEWPGKARFGYKNIEEKGKREVVVEEYESKIVQKAYEWYASQAYSIDLLRAKVLKDFGINWSKGYTDNLLKDPFYYGQMRWKGKLYPHKYPPLITKRLFDQVQAIKASFNKQKFKYAGLPYIYRGLVRCSDCGLSVTPEAHKGHNYYHCTEYNGKHGGKWIREEEITHQLGNFFESIKLPEEVVNDIVKSLKKTHESKMDFQNTQREDLAKERQTYVNRCDQLYLDKLDGRITEDAYDKFYTAFRDRTADLDARLSMLQDAEDNYYITANYILELAKRAFELFQSSEVEEKRQLIKLTLQNLRLEGKTVRFEATKPFDSIADFADRKLWLPNVSALGTYFLETSEDFEPIFV